MVYRPVCDSSLTGCIAVSTYIWRELRIGEWLLAQNSGADFVRDHYVDPAEVDLSFPEKKRNLIYIYLESMEAGYADTASGGLFPENLIPELTSIA